MLRDKFNPEGRAHNWVRVILIMACADRVGWMTRTGVENASPSLTRDSFVSPSKFPYSNLPDPDLIPVLCLRRAVVRSLSNNYD
jgi:hypothetical protein